MLYSNEGVCMCNRKGKGWFFHIEKDEYNNYSLSWRGINHSLMLFLIMVGLIVIALIYHFPYLGKIVAFVLEGK